MRYIDRALAGGAVIVARGLPPRACRPRTLRAIVARRAVPRADARPIRTRCSSTSRPAPPPDPAPASSGSSAAFFAMVRAHTWQGTFGDPYYGGNRNFVGWDLLGYPGVRTAVTADDQRLGVVPAPLRRSAYDTDMFNKATAEHRPPGGPRMATQLNGRRRRRRRARRRRRRRGAAAGRGRPRRGWPRGRHLADAPRLRARRDPQQRARLAAGGAEGQSRGADASRRTPVRRPRAPASHPMMNGVGGTTLHYWAQSWRLNPVGLQGRQRDDAALRPRRDCRRASTVEDWPFGYEELEPYYDKVE